MSDQGYIKLYRKSLKSAVWENPNTWKVWCYCLMRANHTNTKINFNNEEVILRAGQFITGRFQGADDCNMKPSTFRDQLKKLIKLKNLDITSDNKKSLITVINWSTYQSNGNISTNSYANNPPSTRHRQECKNDNNNILPAGGRKSSKLSNSSKINNTLTRDEPSYM